MGSKSRGEVRREIGYVAGMATDAPTTNSLGKWYEAFDGWRMAAGSANIADD